MCHALRTVDLVDLPHLEKLDLSWCSNVTKVEILKCPNLRLLDLRYA